MALQKLANETVQLISSSQVITSVHSVVKELVENSLDAKSSNIEIKLVKQCVTLSLSVSVIRISMTSH